ncbi:MAG: DUF3422 family protein [Burkholderiaceae bacterium]
MSWKTHPDRDRLLKEVHARPYESIDGSQRISRLGFLVDQSAPDADRAHLRRLLQATGADPRLADGNHASFAINGIRIRWERHTEFVSYTFLMPMPKALDSSVNPQDSLDSLWLAEIPGLLLSAQRVDLVYADPTETLALARRRLDAEAVVGSLVGDEQFSLFTDFMVKPDQSVHYLVGVHTETRPRRLGRYVQRVLEIETYRMMALLGLPIAREASAQLEASESRLSDLSARLSEPLQRDESALLDSVSQLATEVEAIYARSHSRFSASAAYFALVETRVSELRETPFESQQTVGQFLDRRLGPARQTCAATDNRLANLSRRIAHASELLRTRVSMNQAKGQFDLLKTMTNRQQVQMKMQSTVEGLSVAAITYYGAGLVSYLVKPAVKLGWPIDPTITVALAVPVIAFSVWWGLRRLHQRVAAAISD